MQENQERKQKFESAIKEYFCQAKMYSIRDSFELQKTGDYAYVFGLSSFSEEEREENVYFLVPIDAELELMDKIDGLFESQISPKTVRNSFGFTIKQIVKSNEEFIFPFESDEKEQQYHDKLYRMLNFHYKRQYDVIVPMYQLECAQGVEFPLANAVLYSGGRQSHLATIANNNDNHFRDDDRQQIESCSYLKFPVTGDNNSRLVQAEFEVEQALQVLRFTYPWFEKDGRAFNSAHGVSMWKHSDRVIVYDRTSATGNSIPWYAEIPNGIFRTRRISGELLRDAKKYSCLDSINYHFQNYDRNLVSRRFCRSFKYYDIASQISDADVALANFIISVDILLPSGTAEELTSYLSSLIEKGNQYEGKMTLNEQLTNPDKTTWPERVRLTVSDYKEFYIIRDKVVHGNTMSDAIPDIQVKKSRQIAKNAIRAFAELSRAFNWQSDKEAKKWFKSPCKPPKVIAESAS